MKIYALVGLPGSGKTKLAKEIASNKSAVIIEDLDDHVRFNDCIGRNIIVTDYWLVEEASRASLDQRAVAMGAKKVRYIFFENNPDKCYSNIVERRECLSHYFIKSISARYTIPEGAEVLKVE